MDIGNMHEKLVKTGHEILDIWSWTEKHTDKQTRSSQYFAHLSGAKYKVTWVSKTNATSSWELVLFCTSYRLLYIAGLSTLHFKTVLCKVHLIVYKYQKLKKIHKVLYHSSCYVHCV